MRSSWTPRALALATLALVATALAALHGAPALAQNQQCTNEQLACINRCTSYTDGCIQACNARAAACFNGSGPAAPSGLDSPLNPFAAGGAQPSPFATPAPASPFAAPAPAPAKEAAGEDATFCIVYAQAAAGGVAWRNACPYRVNLHWRTDDPLEACYSAGLEFSCGQMVEPSAESDVDAITGNYVMAACRYPDIPAVSADGSAYCR